MSLGFIVAAVGALALGPGSRNLLAREGTWGFMSGLFGEPYEQRVQMVDSDLDYAPAPTRRRHTHRHADAIHLATLHGAPSTTRQSLCVRLCDGYAFPVGAYHGDSDRAAHESTCQSTCPDAATALYVLPAGADKIDDAVMVGGDRRSYSELPDAFHYTTVLDDACTCHKMGTGGRSASILHDFTLRRGDAVMTASGVKVFHGKGHFPYAGTDFVALSHSRDVRRTDRATFGAIERASLKAPPGLEPAEPMLSDRGPASWRPRTADASFERQASRD